MCRKKVIAMTMAVLIMTSTVQILAKGTVIEVKETKSIASINDNNFISLDNSITQKEEITDSNTINKNIPESYKKVCENDSLELYLNEETLGIKVKNKITNYVWSSTIDEDKEELNDTWKDFSKSGFTLEYSDKKGKIEKVSTVSMDMKIDIKENKNGFEAKVFIKKLGFRFNLKVTLNEKGVNVELPNESIKEEKEIYKMQSIYIYPFLGATENYEVPGYMFVPDGSGALIRFDSDTAIEKEPFIKRIYGDDYGIVGSKNEKDDGVLKSETIHYPVFGITNNTNKNAISAIIDKGAEYGEVNAYPSGATTDYNWITSKFIYRENFFKPINKKGDGIVSNQSKRNNFDIKVDYNFLSNDDANYVGMAKDYQNYLLKKGVLDKSKDNSKDSIPLKLEFLGFDTKEKLLGAEVVKMTTVEDVDNIISDLREAGVDDMDVIFKGWAKGGVTKSYPTNYSFEKKIGTEKQWKQLIQKYDRENVPIYLYSDFVLGNEGAKNFSKLKDSSLSIAKQMLKIDDNGQYSLMPAGKTLNVFEKQSESLNDNGFSNLAMGTLGRLLFSNHSEYNPSTRDESLNMYNDLLEKSKDMNIGLYNANDYLWKYTDNMLEIPMKSSNYMIFTDTVPFIQIVLKGYMNYYATPSNFNSNSEDAILKMIDYGAYPSFYLTKENSSKLIETNSNWLYTSEYDIWKDEIIKEYNMTNEALKVVKDETIVDREVLADNIVKVTYSNSVDIFINYNEDKAEIDGVNIEGKSFKVVEGGSK